MNNLLIKNIIRFILLILVQVLVFNNMNLGGYLHPSIYVLFLLLLPVNINRSLLLILAFFTGLTIDYFTGTIGLNAAASVFLAYLRPGTIRLFFRNQEFGSDKEPKLSIVGVFGFFKYTLVLVFMHQLLLFYLEVLSFNHFFFTLNKVFQSTLLSTFVIIIILLFFTKRSK
ncbi:MAG: rod shape-determining protein MreD [Bacteroidota bacterium]